MDIYAARGYREFVSESIRPETGRSWGSVKKLADVLKCHSTYVSQIIKGKADMSVEQAIAFCQHIKLNGPGTEHFLDLVNLEKAGSKQSRDYFQQRIDRRLADRIDLKRRLTVTDELKLDHQVRYYNGYLPQLVHICTQVPGGDRAETIAAMLRLDLKTVTDVLAELVDIGLLEILDGKVCCLQPSVYIGKDSPMVGRFHANWRAHTMNALNLSVKLNGTHYSSVLTMSAETAKAVRELVIQHVQETRDLILPSPSDHVYAFCLDFYPITENLDVTK
jgi:plasmid maintenance system antidote protein VapI